MRFPVKDYLQAASAGSPRWLFRLLLAALSVWAALAVSASGADTDAFISQYIPVTDRLLRVAPLQYDDRPGAELMVAYVDPQGERRIKIYRHAADRRYEQEAIASFPIPATVFGFQISDWDSDRRDELLLLGLEGVFAIEFDATASPATPKPVCTFERLFAIPDPAFLSELRFAIDLNGDRVAELVLPCFSGVRLMSRKENGYALVKALGVGYRAKADRAENQLRSFAGDGMTFELPRISAWDLNTDRSLDVLIETAAGIAVFHQTGNLQFSEKPNRVLEVRRVTDATYFDASSLIDINRDNLVDYCRVYTQKSREGYKTLLEIFLGNIQDGLSQRPTKRVVLDQLAIGMATVDLNRNGSASIVVATIPSGATSLMKALVYKSMPVELQVFQPINGVFGDAPVAVKKVSCAIDFVSGSLPSRYVGCFDGDLDRDSKNELVIVTDDAELQVFKGEATTVFADKSLFSREAGGVTMIEARDLDADAKDDLIVVGHDEDGREQITLLWTK